MKRRNKNTLENLYTAKQVKKSASSPKQQAKRTILLLKLHVIVAVQKSVFHNWTLRNVAS
jgi:hypothetical protein